MTAERAIDELIHWMESDCYLEAPSNDACKLAISALEEQEKQKKMDYCSYGRKGTHG